MDAARAAKWKLGRRKPPQLPDPANEAFEIFKRQGYVRLKFGDLGIYTVCNERPEVSEGYMRYQWSPVGVWWQGTTYAERDFVILHNSRVSYGLPYRDDWGQALQVNLTGTEKWWPSYGKYASVDAAAMAYIDNIFSGISMHRLSCTLIMSNNVYQYMPNVEVEILHDKVSQE